MNKFAKTLFVLSAIAAVSAITTYQLTTNMEAIATPFVSNNDPNKIVDSSSNSDMAIPSPFTEEEKSKIIDVVKNDAQVGEILKKGPWHVLFVQSISDENANRVGAQVHIILDKTQWFEGDYVNPFTKQEQKIKLWTSALDVVVDPNTNSVIGFEPGLAQHAGKIPIEKDEPEAKKVAHKRAVSELGENVETDLLGMLQTKDNPKGIAVFSITQNQEEKMLVTVDLDKNTVDEGRTGKILKAP